MPFEGKCPHSKWENRAFCLSVKSSEHVSSLEDREKIGGREGAEMLDVRVETREIKMPLLAAWTWAVGLSNGAHRLQDTGYICALFSSSCQNPGDWQGP